MTLFQLEIQLVAAIVAGACALPGTFLVLRSMAMMSDAISHAILPGLVVAFFLTGSLNSPLLLAGGAAVGVCTVALVELVRRTRLVREDAAIGLVFPALFSAGVILIARYAGDVHLDTDAVLLGELALAPFDRWIVGGYDLGPQALYTMSTVALASVLFVTLFYKELQLATFDAALAATLGLMPVVLHYALMALVSVTAVAAFDAVGSILVVALMVGPPAAAHLLTDRLDRMVFLGVGIGVGCAVSGYWLAHALDASIAGSMATTVGVAFLYVFLFAPARGVVAVQRRRRRQRWTFACKMLTIHLMQHENLPDAALECHIDHLQDHLRWEVDFAGNVVRQATQAGLIGQVGSQLVLTTAGRRLANEAIVRD